jgi:hypothetical protein
MKTLHAYRIWFTRNGETKSEVKPFDALNPGSAFAKCVRKYPGCRLLEAWLEGRLVTGGGVVCRLSYAPPSTVRIIAEPTPNEEQILFGFFEELSLNPRKQITMRRRRSCKPNSSSKGELS